MLQYMIWAHYIVYLAKNIRFLVNNLHAAKSRVAVSVSADERLRMFGEFRSEALKQLTVSGILTGSKASFVLKEFRMLDITVRWLQPRMSVTPTSDSWAF
jgi:hypothetical protein